MTTATRTPEDQMRAQALREATAHVREVYERQRKREEMGEIPYDPRSQARVVFTPEVRGGYRAELRPVNLSDLREAQEQGADYWDNTRGWIRYGRKPETEFGTTVSVAAVEGDLAGGADQED